MWEGYWNKMGGSNGFGRGLTAEELLRREIPDLQEKFDSWLQALTVLRKLNKDLDKFNFVDKLFNRNGYKEYTDCVIKQERLASQAEDDYDFLKKMVGDYD